MIDGGTGAIARAVGAKRFTADPKPRLKLMFGQTSRQIDFVKRPASIGCSEGRARNGNVTDRSECCVLYGRVGIIPALRQQAFRFVDLVWRNPHGDGGAVV